MIMLFNDHINHHIINLSIKESWIWIRGNGTTPISISRSSTSPIFKITIYFCRYLKTLDFKSLRGHCFVRFVGPNYTRAWHWDRGVCRPPLTILLNHSYRGIDYFPFHHQVSAEEFYLNKLRPAFNPLNIVLSVLPTCDIVTVIQCI